MLTISCPQFHKKPCATTIIDTTSWFSGSDIQFFNQSHQTASPTAI